MNKQPICFQNWHREYNPEGVPDILRGWEETSPNMNDIVRAGYGVHRPYWINDMFLFEGRLIHQEGFFRFGDEFYVKFNTDTQKWSYGEMGVCGPKTATEI